MNLIEYRRKMALQEREIAEYKWLKSEQKGYDIGAEQAILDWSGNGEAIRFNETYQSHKGDIMIKCNTTCGEGRCGAEYVGAGALLREYCVCRALLRLPTPSRVAMRFCSATVFSVACTYCRMFICGCVLRLTHPAHTAQSPSPQQRWLSVQWLLKTC